MADEIRQVFTLDASQALDTLTKLDSAFETFNKRLASVASSLQGFNGSSVQTSAAARQVSQSFQSATQATERLSLSMGLLSRVVTTQAIVRALNTLRMTFQDAVDGAIRFQEQLSLIQTLSPQDTIGGLSDEVRRLSDSFNLDIVDVAKAKLEALSSGFTSAAQQADVLNSSFRFSKVSGADAATSLDLVSSILNSYGKNSREAEAISAKLFKTLDVGKVTGAELAKSLGRVTPVASQLGVSLDEVLAQFAALTIGGVNANEAATRISGTLSALIKPSEAAGEAFRKLGFSSAESAIQTLGLQGTLKGLISTTDGSAAAIAKIFPNIRALQDVLRTVPNDNLLSDFKRQIEGINSADFDKIVNKRLAADFEIATAEARKLSNALTVDLGQALLADVASVAKFTGGVDSLVSVTKALSPVLEVGTLALAAYSAAALTGANSNAVFASSFAAVTRNALLFAGAATVGNFIGNQLNESLTASERAFDESQKRAIEGFRKTEAERLSVLEQTDSERLSAALRNVQELNKLYLQDVSNAEAAAKLQVKNAQRTSNDILEARENLSKSLDKAVGTSRDLQRDSRDRVTDLGLKSDDRRFDRSTRNLGDAGQVLALTQRASSLANQAADALNKASAQGDEKAVQRAVALFNKAQASGEEAQAIAERTQNRALENKAAEALESTTRKQIDAERQLQAAQNQRQVGLDALSKKQISILDNLRDQVDIVRRNSNILDSNGQLLPADEIAKRQAASQEALKQIAQSGLSASDLAQFDRLGLGQQGRDFNLKLAQQSLQLNFDVVGGTQRIQQQVQASFDRFKVKLGFDVSDLENVIGRQLTTPDQVARAFADVKSQAAEARAALSQVGVDQSNLDALRTKIANIGTTLDSTGRAFERSIVGPIGASAEQLNQVDNLKSRLDALSKSTSISDQEIVDLFNDVGRLKDSTLGINNLATNVGLGFDVGDLARGVGFLKEIQTLQQNTPPDTSRLQLLESTIRNIEASNPAATFQSAANAIGNGVGPANQIADAWTRAADAAERVSASSFDRPDAKGFALGGVAHGTDSINAMLSPGETVVPNKPSAKFFPELQAIRAGVQPAPRTFGGDTNINIGDINVNGVGSPEATARQVVNRIRREERRGTSRL